MMEIDYLIHGDYVLTMTDSGEPIVDGAVAVKNTEIIDINSYENLSRKYRPKEILGGKGRVVFPGLINTHTHAAMVYFRGLADDLPLKEWLEGHIWPAEGKGLSAEFVSDAVELACLEMLRAGITTYNDMYFFEDAAARMTKGMGMRAVLGAGVVDFPSVGGKSIQEYFDKAEGFIKEWLGDGFIVPAIAPHAPYTCGPDTFKRVKEIADRFNVPIHTHLSETEWEIKEIKRKYGKTPVELLDSIGFLDGRVLAVHCIWITEKEIEILAKRGVNVSHCIKSSLKLASGISPIVELLKKGIKVTFGTDGAASNNNLDILSEMSTAARLHKAICKDPTVLNAKQAIIMATRFGAEVLGLGDRIGSLEKGKLADIVIANLRKPHLLPVYDIYSHIVYSMVASDIESVMVNGEVLIKNNKFLKKSENEIMEKVAWWNKKIKGVKEC